MERLAHPFFMMALILYYVPKCFKMKKKYLCKDAYCSRKYIYSSNIIWIY